MSKLNENYCQNCGCINTGETSFCSSACQTEFEKDAEENYWLANSDAAHWTGRDWAEYYGEPTSFTDQLERWSEEDKKEYDAWVEEQNTNNSLKY